jgi:hypothetical protein
MLKNSSRVFLLSVVVLVCGFTVGYEGQFQTAKAGPPPKPFTAHQTETGYSREQNAPPAVTASSLARRSDGSWVHSYDVTSPHGEMGRVVEYLDVRSRLFVHPEPFTKSKMTSHLSESELPVYIQAAFEVCDGTEKDESQPQSNILGYEVVRIVRNLGYGVDTRWVAPALDCYPLESSVLFRSGAHNETKVTSIQEGDPPDSAFQVPTDFVERSPEELQAVYAQKYPGLKFFGDKEMETMKARYRSHR